MKTIKKSLLAFVTIITFIIMINECFPRIVVLDEEKLLFRLGEKNSYKVNFNGIYVGRIEWEYLGRSIIDNKLIDKLLLSSDIKILKLFSIKSKERLFLDSKTHLPLKIERDIEFFGKKERILEEYNQSQYYVKITKVTSSGTEEKIIQQKTPIHNVIALLYFFPRDIKLDLQKSFSFNLPTQQLQLKVTAHKMLETRKGSYEVYVLEGKPRKYRVRLEKEKRIPLQIEFPVMLGRVTILID